MKEDGIGNARKPMRSSERGHLWASMQGFELRTESPRSCEDFECEHRAFLFVPERPGFEGSKLLVMDRPTS